MMDGVSREVVFIATHRPQLELSGIPEIYWNLLCKKINDQIYDSGESFSLLLLDYEDNIKESHDPTWSVQIIKENGIAIDDPTQIYLIDHAWTFRPNVAKQQLREVPGLLDRMYNLVHPQEPIESRNDQIDFVFDHMWKYAQFYTINSENATAEDNIPIWYIMDELGSGIQHSDKPSFKCIPFIHLPDRVTYTLLFPIKNVKEGDFVTRNYIENYYDNPKYREALLLPWQEFISNNSFVQYEPNPEYFLSGHIKETLPDDIEIMQFNLSNKVKVYSEYDRINQYLTHPYFEIVDNEDIADVLWYMTHFKSYKEFSENFPNKFINQFPFENVLTIKDLLSIVARRKQKGGRDEFADDPIWLPKTFNLKTELLEFIAYFHERESKALDNHWICKPFNLARGLDTYISSNLNFIVRLPLTGPKIAQKYIENPVLFMRYDLEAKVKFDVRYVILLKSVQPLDVYIYKNFFLRFANESFEMSNFDDYQRHFTVMNYNENASLFRLLCADFIIEWTKQYENYPWRNIEDSIVEMLKELFESATERPPPCGIAPSKQSRALYAVDLMLAWDYKKKNRIIQPKLLEINWMPDCNRACEYYPEFYNEIFSLFFLDEIPESCRSLFSNNK